MKSMRNHGLRGLGLASTVSLLLILSFGCSKKETPPETDLTGGPGSTITDPGADGTNGDNGGIYSDGGDDGTARRNLQDVFFDYDRHSLRGDTRRVLDDNADLLQLNTDWFVMLEGHCDERGTVEYNLALGEKRARAVKDYLTRLGIDDSRLRTISYGEERAFDPGHTEAAWAQNRRVHFVRQ